MLGASWHRRAGECAWRRGVAAGLLACGLFGPPALGASGGAAPGPVAVAATPAAIPDLLLSGQKARFLGGLALSAKDPRFGGFSGMSLRRGQLRAVSDRGAWLQARMTTAASGAATGLTAPRLGALSAADGASLEGWTGDAEALAPDGAGGLWIGFENPHRIAAHPRLGATPRATAPPLAPPLDGVAPNRGVEALARLSDGALLAFSEFAETLDAPIRAWRLAQDEDALPLLIERIDGFAPSGADLGPDGALYLLERRADWATGLRMRIRRFDAATLSAAISGEAASLGLGETLLELDLRALIDNMEALSVEARADGQLVLTTLSDDNFSR
ncbi:MAG: esterase-like activity of phytase family protein, partial [Pseudomonadota bacterium]